MRYSSRRQSAAEGWEVNGREAREIRIKIHQTCVFVSLDRSSAARGRGTGQGRDGADQLRFAILARYDRDQVRASWRDGEGGRLESFIGEIAVEVVTTAEISYRESRVGVFEWRVRRKAQLEEEACQHQLQLEREELERRRQLEQARIDRLLDEAASLRRATDIRAYVDAVKTAVASKIPLGAPDAMERWSKWALAEADRIDPVKSARFLEGIEADDSEE